MTVLFIDTNIMIDILAQREPFYTDAARIMTLAEKRSISLVASSLSFVNAYYVLIKNNSRNDLLESLKKFRIVCDVADVSEIHIDKSLHSGFTDFEDAVQYYSAVHYKCDIFITRNKKDYKKAELPLMTATEFLTSVNRK